jgi:hypothetical protein
MRRRRHALTSSGLSLSVPYLERASSNTVDGHTDAPLRPGPGEACQAADEQVLQTATRAALAQVEVYET